MLDRRENQGLRGVSVTADGTLYAEGILRIPAVAGGCDRGGAATGVAHGHVTWRD